MCLSANASESSPFAFVVFVSVVGLRSKFSTMLKKEATRRCSLKGKEPFLASAVLSGELMLLHPAWGESVNHTVSLSRLRVGPHFRTLGAPSRCSR